jgi:hypothetical protein
MIHDSLDRLVAQSLGHEGVLALMRRRHPDAQIVGVAYDPSFPAEAEAWAYGDVDDVRITLTGKLTRVTGSVTNCRHRPRTLGSKKRPYSWRDVINSL